MTLGRWRKRCCGIRHVERGCALLRRPAYSETVTTEARSATDGGVSAASIDTSDNARARSARTPSEPPIRVARLSISELTGPGPAVSAFLEDVFPEESDLTTNAGTGSPPIGQRIVLTGRVTDEKGAGVPDTLVEIWQANAAGRYRHKDDGFDAPLDPNFVGKGRCRTDPSGTYRFMTVRPGAYPFVGGSNTWRAAHIHFSLLGPTWPSRLITQMYFEGDPLHAQDAIFHSTPDAAARERLIAKYAHEITIPFYALGYRFDIVLRGEASTPFERTA